MVSSKVRDTDNDGLLDLWESSSEPILDPTGQPLPLLVGDGRESRAQGSVRQIGSLKTNGPVSYGGIVKRRTRIFRPWTR